MPSACEKFLSALRWHALSDGNHACLAASWHNPERDSSGKVQFLDLSCVPQGEFVRDERFGYVELATHPKLSPREFIRCSGHDGRLQVTFSTLQRFDLATGQPLTNE